MDAVIYLLFIYNARALYGLKLLQIKSQRIYEWKLWTLTFQTQVSRKDKCRNGKWWKVKCRKG